MTSIEEYKELNNYDSPFSHAGKKTLLWIFCCVILVFYTHLQLCVFLIGLIL